LKERGKEIMIQKTCENQKKKEIRATKSKDRKA